MLRGTRVVITRDEVFVNCLLCKLVSIIVLLCGGVGAKRALRWILFHRLSRRVHSRQHGINSESARSCVYVCLSVSSVL